MVPIPAQGHHPDGLPRTTTPYVPHRGDAPAIRKIRQRAFNLRANRNQDILELKYPGALMFAFVTVADPAVVIHMRMDEAAPDEFTFQDLIDWGLDEVIHGHWYITRQQAGVRYTAVYEPLIPEPFFTKFLLRLRNPTGGVIAGETFYVKWLVDPSLRAPRKSLEGQPPGEGSR